MLILLSDIRQERKRVLCNLRANDSDGSEIPIPELSARCPIPRLVIIVVLRALGHVEVVVDAC